MWKLKGTYAIGGLEEIGFIPSTDLVVVLSPSGEAVFDCVTGERTYRNYKGYDWARRIDHTSASLNGIAKFPNARVIIHGLSFGDSLAKQLSTEKKDRLSAVDVWDINNPHVKIRLDSGFQGPLIVGDSKVCEIRAFGFAETGNSFVVASSCDLVIYTRI